MAADYTSNRPDNTAIAAKDVSKIVAIERVCWFGGRALIAMLFILSGGAKILGPKPFLDHMVQVGVPTALLPAVITLEIGAGFAILIGWRLRYFAAALAVFCVLTALIFHHHLQISAERTSFFKDLAIGGGLFAIASSAGRGRTGKMGDT